MIVEFDLQDHLQNMEERIGDKICAVHTDVKDHRKRIGYLETTQGQLAVQLKWLWGISSSAVMAALLWIGAEIFGRQ